MPDKLAAYRRVAGPLPARHRYWPLFGAGFERLGLDGRPAETAVPGFGPDELLVRHDAVGICFSDIKVIRAGQDHPRIYEDMQTRPVILGHEVSLTVVGVGARLAGRYRVGGRFVLQADIYVDGISRAYGYDLPGGFSQFNTIGEPVLNGDAGSYLVPIQPQTGYAESALTEPWACVEAAYTPVYRSAWKEGGRVWIAGAGDHVRLGRAARWRPRMVALSGPGADFATRVRAWASETGVDVKMEDGRLPEDLDQKYDDIVLVDPEPELVMEAGDRLAIGGALNLVGGASLSRPVEVDIGRLHYDGLLLVGTEEDDLSEAYKPVRTQLKTGGSVWVLGAAGPMGHMHIQRALEMPDGPQKIVATNLREPRMFELQRKFSGLAAERGVELVCKSEDQIEAEFWAGWLQAQSGGRGFDDVVVLAPNVKAVQQAAGHLGENGVLNVFAGLPRGTRAALDLNLVIRQGVRLFGTSGSSIEDLCRMRDLAEAGTLSPNRSVSAVAGLDGVADGLRAVAEGRFPGKVVIFPNIRPFPLTPLEGLEKTLPAVFERLAEGPEWTREAEDEFLRRMLP